MSLFEKGQRPAGAGRKPGVRNKLSHKFLTDLQALYEERGAEYLRVFAAEEPGKFCQLIASLLPKEIDVTQTNLTEIGDNDLDAITDYIRRELAARTGSIGIGENPTTHH